MLFRFKAQTLYFVQGVSKETSIFKITMDLVLTKKIFLMFLRTFEFWQFSGVQVRDLKSKVFE